VYRLIDGFSGNWFTKTISAIFASISLFYLGLEEYFLIKSIAYIEVLVV